jgi:UDP-N-acetylglucosamine 1-carboxyvinyltransferase
MTSNKDYFVIEGLGGAKKLHGKISVSGSKNAVLPAMASAFLFDNPITITNIPDTEDVKRMAELIKGLKARISHKDKRTLTIDPRNAKKTILEREISKRFRASIILVGPVLARFGKVSFPHPGGCVIGARPIDLFLEGFQKMGATFFDNGEMFTLESKTGKLNGTEINFKLQSVTATETFMMAGILAQGTTVLRNVALEPEVTSVAEFLVSCGARISGIGTTTLTIEGGDLLTSTIETKYEVIPDRIEAGSFLILGALAASRLTIEKCVPEHLAIPIQILRETGAEIETGKNFIKIKSGETNSCSAISIRTHEYPGFPTDLQAPFTVFLTQSCGEGTVFETIFEGRLNYISDLVKMGADIKMWDAHHITIKGPVLLKGKEVEGPDIRAGIAFIMAGIIAEGQSIIRNAYFIDRGYEKIEKRLRKIGVNIRRVTS